MIGRLVSFWGCLFLGAMLNLWGVYSHTTSIPEFLEANEKSGMLVEGCPTIQGPPEKSLIQAVLGLIFTITIITTIAVISCC